MTMGEERNADVSVGWPWTRGRWQADVLLALAVALVEVVGTSFAASRQPDRLSLDAPGYILLVAGSAALVARRRSPLATYLVVVGTTLAYVVVGYPQGPIWLALIIAFFNLVLAGPQVVAVIGLGVGYAGFLWLGYLLGREPAPSTAEIIGLAAWLLVLLFAAEYVRVRRERMLEAVRIREEGSRRRASEERVRIARELHDVLGHHLSLINVQAGVALHVNEELPNQARSALDAIHLASKEALTELRSVLEILRDSEERAPRSPSPTLARLEELVTRANAAGIQVRTSTHGEARPLPFGVDVAAYRIVQEALTNVTRHARTSAADVRINYGEDDVTVQIDDDGRGSSDGSEARAGTGILGMRERVAALNGELETGPRPEGGFRVRARLPLGDAS
jgi:signal transduction histidine kinase